MRTIIFPFESVSLIQERSQVTQSQSRPGAKISHRYIPDLSRVNVTRLVSSHCKTFDSYICTRTRRTRVRRIHLRLESYIAEQLSLPRSRPCRGGCCAKKASLVLLNFFFHSIDRRTRVIRRQCALLGSSRGKSTRGLAINFSQLAVC